MKQSRNGQLAKNTLILLFGKICTQFLSFFLLPLYTSLLNTENFGAVDLINTYTLLLVSILSLQLENAVFRFLIDKRGSEEGKTKIISTTLLTGIFLVGLSVIGFFLIGKVISFEYIFWLLFIIIATMWSNILLQIARGLGDNTSYAIGSFLSAFFTILFNILFLVVFHMGPSGMFLSLVLSNLICGFYIFFKNRIYSYLSIHHFSKSQTVEMLRYSVPLIPNGISWWVINASDRIIISNLISIGANGIYAVSNKFSNIFNSFVSIFMLTWTETAAVHLNDSDRDSYFTDIFDTMFRFLVTGCVLIIAGLPILFPIFINIQFADAYQYIPILMLSTVFNSVIGLISVVYVAKKLTKEIAKTSFLSALINILVNILLIKYIGIYAAALSTLIAFMSMAIYRYYDVQKYVKMRLSWNSILSMSGLFALTVVFYYWNNFIGSIFCVFVTVLLSILLNRHILKSSFRFLKRKIKKI